MAQMVEHIERNFRGLDLSQAPENIGEGYLQLADNCSLDGRDVITRPGFTALLTSAQTSGIYAYTPLVLAMSGEKALYCADSVLRYWAGSTSASTVTGTGTVAHATAQIATVPGAGFLVDGSMNLKRIAFDSSGVPTGAAAVTELNRPDTPSLSLTSRNLSTLNASGWASDGVTGANVSISSNPGFTGGGTGTLGNYWYVWAGAPDCYTNASVSALPSLSGSRTWLRLDTTGDVACLAKTSTGSTSPYVDNGYATNSNWLTGSANYRYCTRFEFSCRVISLGSASKAANALIQFFDTSATPSNDSKPIYETTISLDPLSPGKDRTLIESIDLSDLNLPSIGYIRLFLMPNKDSTATADGPYVTDVRFTPLHPDWWVVGSGTSPGAFYSLANYPSLMKGLMLAFAFGSSNDYSAVQTIGVTTTVPAGISPAPNVNLLLMDSSSNVWRSSETQPLSAVMTWDLTTVPSSIRSGVFKMALLFNDDATIVNPEGYASTGSLLVDDLLDIGNLTPDLNYWYVVSEIDDNGDSTLVDVIFSDGSAPTSSATPTTSRVGKLTVAAKKNSGADYVAVYRFGGTYLPSIGDPAPPTGRLVAMVSWTASVSYGGDADKPSSPASGYPIVFGNPYISWDYTTRVFVDNTPDSWLAGADTYAHGREKAPTAPTTVASWDNRLWLGKGTDLYASWEMEPGRNAGIYWTRIAEPITTDPDAPKKGWWVSLNLAPQDSIKKVMPVGRGDATFLAVLTRYSAFIVTRSGARAFDRQNAAGGDLYFVQQLKGDDVGGVVGVYAATVFDNALYWLSDRGLLRWRMGDSSPVLVGDSVRRYLNGIDPAITYTSTALAKCTLMAAPHYLYLSVPSDASATTPDTTLVWHEREKGWTRWSKGFASGAGEVMGGFDGQLWRIGGSGDITTAGGSATAVSMSMQTRRFGDGTMVCNPGWLFYDVHLPGATNGTLTFTALGDGSTGASVTQTTLGVVSRRVRVSRSGAGRRADLSLSASTIKRLRVRALGLDLIPSHSRRV